MSYVKAASVLCSLAGIFGVASWIASCKPKNNEGNSSGSSLPSSNRASSYQPPPNSRGADLISSQSGPRCLNPKVFKEIELNVNRVTITANVQLETLEEYQKVLASYEAVRGVRQPTRDEAQPLIDLRAKINLWGAQDVFLPNNSVALDSENINEAVAFLNYLKSYPQVEGCKADDYVRRDSLTEHQRDCQIRKDWDNSKMGIFWVVYECQTEGGYGIFKRVLTIKNQDLVPNAQSVSTTTYVPS